MIDAQYEIKMHRTWSSMAGANLVIRKDPVTLDACTKYECFPADDARQAVAGDEVNIGKSTKRDSWEWTHSENRTSPEGSKGARSLIATRIRPRARFENYVLADAARSDPSIRTEICLSGRKDRFGITKAIGKPTTGNYF